MMMMPIEASIPCTAALGKNSPRTPARDTPNRIWITPAATPTPRPAGRPPGRPRHQRRRGAELGHAADAMTISPAAGPLMVSSELLIALPTMPPMIAVNTPAIAGSRRPGRSPGTAARIRRREADSASAFHERRSPSRVPRAGRRLDPPPLPGPSAARLTSCRHRTGGGDGTPQHTRRHVLQRRRAESERGGARRNAGGARTGGRPRNWYSGLLGRTDPTSTARRPLRTRRPMLPVRRPCPGGRLEVDGTPTGVRGFEPDLTLAFRLGDFGRPRPEARAAGTEGDDEKEQQGVKARQRRVDARRGVRARTRGVETRNNTAEASGTTPDGGWSMRGSCSRRSVASWKKQRGAADAVPGGPTSSAPTGGRRASSTRSGSGRTLEVVDVIGDVAPAVGHAGRDDDDVAGLDHPRHDVGAGDRAAARRAVQDRGHRAVGGRLAPVTIRPPVTSVPPPETMM